MKGRRVALSLRVWQQPEKVISRQSCCSDYMETRHMTVVKLLALDSDSLVLILDSTLQAV